VSCHGRASPHQGAVAGERIRLQCSQIVYDSGPQRVEVDIGHQLPEISVFFAENRFVAVLKKAPVGAMPAVESHRIAGQKPAHARGDWTVSGAQKQVGVILISAHA
jgi:hypothetical protein